MKIGGKICHFPPFLPCEYLTLIVIAPLLRYLFARNNARSPEQCVVKRWSEQFYLDFSTVHEIGGELTIFNRGSGREAIMRVKIKDLTWSSASRNARGMFAL